MKKQSRVIFKVDFEKLYDFVDWYFLNDMMVGMKFGVKWRGCIRECITSASASVLVNDCPIEEFKLEKGLR